MNKTKKEAVVIRCDKAGVYFGRNLIHNEKTGFSTLYEARHLWSWKTNEGAGTFALAKHGLNESKQSGEVEYVQVRTDDIVSIAKVKKDVEETFTK